MKGDISMQEKFDFLSPNQIHKEQIDNFQQNFYPILIEIFGTTLLIINERKLVC